MEQTPIATPPTANSNVVIDAFPVIFVLILSTDGQNLNFAISSETIRDAIAKSFEDQSKYAVPAPTGVARETPTSSARSKKSDKPTPRSPPATDKLYVAPRVTVEPPLSSNEVIRMEIPNKGITLILPADWEGIPPTTLEEHKNIIFRRKTRQ